MCTVCRITHTHSVLCVCSSYRAVFHFLQCLFPKFFMRWNFPPNQNQIDIYMNLCLPVGTIQFQAPHAPGGSYSKQGSHCTNGINKRTNEISLICVLDSWSIWIQQNWGWRLRSSAQRPMTHYYQLILLHNDHSAASHWFCGLECTVVPSLLQINSLASSSSSHQVYEAD